MAVEKCFSRSVVGVFVILLGVRLLSALYNNITDCDETYNYWEPTHFILHGRGFETWEYSPAYAVRSYAYILLHVAPLLLVSSLSRIIQFYSLRIIFAVVCTVCETYLYYVVRKRFNPRVSLWLFLFLVSSCGMFISSTAFLPSSFTMYCTMVSMATWIDHKEHISIFAVALGSIIGWPFAAALGVPLAVNIILNQRRFLFFISWSLVSLIVIGGPVVYIDSRLYGKVVFAPLNIILYNVFGKGGPDLYGTEPWTYYFINGFLNLNFSFILCLFSLPLVELKVISDSYIQKFPKQKSTAAVFRPIVMTVLIWVAIFFTRPHKEERFLFPIYPLVCLLAAISLHLVHELVPTIEYIFRVNKSRRSALTGLVKIITTCLLVIHGLLGVSRVLALYQGYQAPLRVYYNLNSETLSRATQSLREVNLCVGKEWYRFTSSFFLPGNGLETSTPRWKLKFIRSEFRGQLPKPYSTMANTTAIIPTDMNDMNKEETSRYFSIGRCHYLIDSDGVVPTTYEPRYHTNTAVWEPVYSFSFLDSKRSNRFFRAYYVPWFSDKLTKYVEYFLLHNILS